MATKPKVKQICNGTFGKVYVNNELCYDITKASATLKPSRESVGFAGDLMNDSKITALDGEWSFTVKKVYARGKALAEKLKQGIDPRADITMYLKDPTGVGYENVALQNCWFNDISLANFERGSLIEEEFSGGFTDYAHTTTMGTDTQWDGED